MSYFRLFIEGDQFLFFIYFKCYVDEELVYDCVESDIYLCLLKILVICVSFVCMFYSRMFVDVQFVWEMICVEVD